MRTTAHESAREPPEGLYVDMRKSSNAATAYNPETPEPNLRTHATGERSAKTSKKSQFTATTRDGLQAAPNTEAKSPTKRAL